MIDREIIQIMRTYLTERCEVPWGNGERETVCLGHLDFVPDHSPLPLVRLYR